MAEPKGKAEALVNPGRNIQVGVESSEKTVESPTLSDLFIDGEDGALDVSAFLKTARGFLPIGSVITEPAVGYGGVFGLLFLHDSIENRAEMVKKRDANGSPVHVPPPSITGLMGFGTENGSWGSGLFHMQVFKDDRVRYLGGVFYTALELDYYGSGGELALPVDHLSYTLDGYYTIQQLSYRVGETSLFFGVNYKYMTYDTEFKLGLNIPSPPEDLPTVETSLSSGGVGLFVEYDTRSSIFTPDFGVNAKLGSTFYETAFGSDRIFRKTAVNLRGWLPLHDAWVLGLRTDANWSHGDIPFYMQPSVDLRGISVSRYQGEYTVTSEAELRWDLTRRWSLLGFFGSGWVAKDDMGDLSFQEGKLAGGVGFRYFISKVFGIRTGMDLAWSKGEQAIYFTTGTAWGQR